MSLKYPTHGKAHPYRVDPDSPPDWFTNCDKAQFGDYLMFAYFAAMEDHVANMPSRYLKATLKEAESDPDNVDYMINCNMHIETRPYIAMMKGEVAYRKRVDAQRKRRLTG